MAKNWMVSAVKHPGVFTKKSKSAGMSVAAYAAQVTKPGSKASGTTKRQANLAQTFAKFRPKKKKLFS